MKNISPFRSRLSKIFLLAGLVVSSALAGNAAPESTTYAPIKLRGYGTLSGAFTPETIDGKAASTLKIVCEDEAKAQLLQAKYLSDLQTFAGVQPVKINAGNEAQVGYSVEGGVIAAARSGSSVTILFATTAEDLSKLILEKSAGAFSFSSDAVVPMYLNRWDKFSFRFYYGPFVKPQDVKRIVDYDPSQDFIFAKDNHVGMVFWHTPLSVDNAEGITNMPWIEWAVKAAKKDELPVGINDGIEHITWAYNRYPEQIVQYQPGYLGGWYGSFNFGEEITSWNGLEAKDHELGELQQSLRALRKYDNITSWLEPHEEMSHGVGDLLLEYGPVADSGYRSFLKEKYHDVSAVSKRWYGNTTKLKSWDDLKSPEVASFLGWGPDAIDLAGEWRINYDMPFGPAVGATTLDDSSWPSVEAPNNALVKFLPRKPAVYRRHITIDPAWRAAHSKVWIYCWDLNNVREAATNPQATVQIYVNGTLLPETPLKITQDHWVALDASSVLKDGDNLIAITLPNGMFNYRAYLSPHEPLLYPNLGVNENARWVDFYDWNVWFRGNAVRRGTQMIRQVDPNSGVVLMAPHSYQESISEVAKAYGGDFHDTGSMAGSWQDDVACLAQGMGLPISVEPGGPAKTVPELKAFFGRWLSEGTNAIDYFQHEGDVLWFPELKKTFEDHLPLYTSIGKYHTPTTDVAALYSMRNAGLTDFPWHAGQGYGSTNDLHLGSGQSKWNVRAPLRGDFDCDSLMEASFARGDAARYKVIIDTNTSIMDPPLIDSIDKYVRDGGTFVTFVQSGRHTSLQQDAWPIEKLTGYHVTRLTQKNPGQTGQITWAKDQPIFSGDWITQPKAYGMSMEKKTPDAQDLAYWKDGSVAIGMRHLGKGTIIEIGCRFTPWGLPDRIDRDIWGYLLKSYNRLTEYGFSTDPNASLFTPELVDTGKLFSQILDWRGVERVPAQLDPQGEDGLLRHYVSNNGLYDVWMIWNQSKERDLNVSLKLTGLHPAWAMNLLDGARTNLTEPQIPIHLTAYESAIYLTPRAEVADASKMWFDLQRRWWEGTTDAGKPFPADDQKNARDLTPDWAFEPVSESADISTLVAPKTDDSKWARLDFGIFSIPNYPNVHDGIFRKKFTVPVNWNHGKVALWVQAWDGLTFLGRGFVYLDGKLVKDCGENGITGDLVEGTLKPGTTHVIAIEVKGGDGLVGSRGPAWIAYHPDPAATQDLAGNWETSTDGLHFAAPSPLPGTAQMANRLTTVIDAKESSRTVVFHARTTLGSVRGIIINGRFVSRHHHNIGPEMNLNITPWVKFGQKNDFILLATNAAKVGEVTLEFHPKGTYP